MAPDGYSMLFQSNAVINAAPFLMDRVDFTPDDFEYAGMITAYQTGLAAPKDAPYDDLSGFIAWAKENPGFAYAALSAEARMYMDKLAAAGTCSAMRMTRSSTNLSAPLSVLEITS